MDIKHRHTTGEMGWDELDTAVPYWVLVVPRGVGP